jgi:hypothetical protein
MQRKLDEVGEEIGDARRKSDEDAHKDEGPQFHDSGTIHPEMDDQTIVPPG